MRVSVPFYEDLAGDYLNYIKTANLPHSTKTRFENQTIVFELARQDLLLMNVFLASIIHFSLEKGKTPKEIDLMIGKGDYHELLEWQPNVSHYITITIEDKHDFRAMTQVALCAAVVTHRDESRRAFLAFSFSDDILRLYSMDIHRSPKTQYLEKSPPLFFTGDPVVDERDLKRRSTSVKGLTYFIREDLVPDDLKKKMKLVWKRASQLAKEMETDLRAVVITGSPSFDFVAMQVDSVMFVDLLHLPDWKIILQDNELLDAFLTHELLHTKARFMTSMKNRIMVALCEAAAYYDGATLFTESVLYHYANHYENAIADLAVYKATGKEMLAKYLEYYIAGNVGILTNVKKSGGRLHFDTFLVCAVIGVGATRHQIISDKVRELINFVDKSPFYQNLVELMNEIWDKYSGEPVPVDSQVIQLTDRIKKAT